MALLAPILEVMGERPVTVRLLDLGADKPPAELPRPPEANPFLGVRGVRLLLDPACRAMLETHLRVMLRAAQVRPFRLMIPMVDDAAEILAVQAALERAHDALDAEGLAHRWPLPLGIMVETPAAVLRASALAKHCAFFSIGSNDLTQYVMAAERGNAALATLADPLHPAVLAAMAQCVEGARLGGGIPVSLCGEVGADTRALPLLVGLGLDSLSVGPAALPEVKMRLAELDPHHCRALLQHALAEANGIGPEPANLADWKMGFAVALPILRIAQGVHLVSESSPSDHQFVDTIPFLLKRAEPAAGYRARIG